MIFVYALLIMIIAIDQLSKFFIFGTQAKSLLGDILWIQSEKNTGAAFSIFSGNNIAFIIITSIACIVLFYILISKKFMRQKIEKFSIALILGGAISNLFDRIIFAYVRDFIYLKFINFAVFNIADMAITIGATLLIISMLFFQKKEKEND